MKSRLPDKDETPLKEDETRLGDEGFLNRWSRRKLDAQQTENNSKDVKVVTVKPEEPVVFPTDADMPPLDSLDEDSDYSGFLSPKVSEKLRKQALHKLFHSASINVRDGLDDYDEDFTEFVKLGEVVTADIKHRMDKEIQGRFEESRQEAVNSDVTEETEKNASQVQASSKSTEAEDEKS